MSWFYGNSRARSSSFTDIPKKQYARSRFPYKEVLTRNDQAYKNSRLSFHPLGLECKYAQRNLIRLRDDITLLKLIILYPNCWLRVKKSSMKVSQTLGYARPFCTWCLMVKQNELGFLDKSR